MEFDDSEASSSRDKSFGDCNSHANQETSESENYDQEEKTFLTKSILVTASTIGINNLSPEAATYLADDWLYKLKELLFVARIVMYRNKAKLLTTDDVQKALNINGSCSLIGHDTKEDVNFVYIPQADVYCEEDFDIDLSKISLNDEEYETLADPFIKGAWIMSNDYSEEPSVKKPSSYYVQIAKTILTGSPAHLKVALSDLRTNPKIGPMCPYFLNLVALTIKKISCDSHLINGLLGTIHALIHNNYIDPSPFPSTNRVADSLLKLIINTDVTEDCDDLAVRVHAGFLLAKMVIIWLIEVNHETIIVNNLLQHLDSAKPLQSHYGAIVSLTALGQRSLDVYLWPNMEKYLAQLFENMAASKLVLVQHVMIAILIAIGKTCKKEVISEEQLCLLLKIDQLLYSRFGDSVIPFRRICSRPPIYPCVKKEPNLARLKLKIKTLPIQSFHQRKERERHTDNNPCRENKIIFACVSRNLKFCTKLHKKSSVGDLFILL